jgi:hypothetical protein
MTLFKIKYKNFRFCPGIPGISGTFLNTKAEINGIPYIHTLAFIVTRLTNKILTTK